MTVEDEVRQTCDDIEGLRQGTDRLKQACPEEAKPELSSLEGTLQHFVHDARDARAKLDAGMREGFESLVSSWRERRDRLHAHMHLLEARSALASARRLADDQYFVAAEAELTTALRKVREALERMPADAAMNALVAEIQSAIADVREAGRLAAAKLEEIAAYNQTLLSEITSAA